MRYTAERAASEIFALYEAEAVRGAEPRYVEDVAVGDELPTDGQGADDRDRLHRLRPGLGRPLHPGQQAGLRAAAQAPRASASPTAFGIPDVPERVHWENDLATDVGTPGAYDYGPERCSWLTHHLTNWMGDDGFLRQPPQPDPPPQRRRRLAAHHRRVVDQARPTPTGRPLVDVEQEARNQHGDLSATGTGTIRLPSRR